MRFFYNYVVLCPAKSLLEKRKLPGGPAVRNTETTFSMTLLIPARKSWALVSGEGGCFFEKNIYIRNFIIGIHFLSNVRLGEHTFLVFVAVPFF